MNDQHNCCGTCQNKAPKLDRRAMPSLTDTHKQSHLAPRLPWQWQFVAPKYWGVWLALLLFVPLVCLPLRAQFFIGRQIGKLAFLLGKRRVQDTLTNLSLALPDKSDDIRRQIARQVFINQGIGVFETLCAWFRPNVFKQTFTISGLQHLVQAQKAGRAVILLGGHFTTLDLIGRLSTQFFCASCVYRKQNNPLLEWLVYNARRHIYDEQIASRDVKKLISHIKAGKVIWYTPDQDFGLEHGVMATFFGVPAATITIPRRLARLGNQAGMPVVMTLDMIRKTPDHLPKGKIPHYHISLTLVENYPSSDEVADAQLINDMLETNIKKDLSQWMWFHRRFKTQADDRRFYE